jgi:hypothetical protein
MHGPLNVKVDWLFVIDVSGQIISPIFKGQAAWTLKMGCPETSATNYQSTVRKISQERVSHSGDLKSCKYFLTSY